MKKCIVLFLLIFLTGNSIVVADEGFIIITEDNQRAFVPKVWQTYSKVLKVAATTPMQSSGSTKEIAVVTIPFNKESFDLVKGWLDSVFSKVVRISDKTFFDYAGEYIRYITFNELEKMLPVLDYFDMPQLLDIAIKRYALLAIDQDPERIKQASEMLERYPLLQKDIVQKIINPLKEALPTIQKVSFIQGDPYMQLLPGESAATVFAFSHDDKYLLVGRKDGTITVYDAAKYTYITTLDIIKEWYTPDNGFPFVPKNIAIAKLQFDADRKKLLVQSYFGFILNTENADPKDWQVEWYVPRNEAYSLKNKKVVSAAKAGFIKIIDLDTLPIVENGIGQHDLLNDAIPGQEIKSPMGLAIADIVLNSDYIALNSGGNDIYIIDYNGVEKQKLSLLNTWPQQFTFDDNDNLFVVLGDKGNFTGWDTKTWKKLWETKLDVSPNRYGWFAISNNGKFIAFLEKNGIGGIMHARTGNRLGTFSYVFDQALPGEIAFDPADQDLLVANGSKVLTHVINWNPDNNSKALDALLIGQAVMFAKLFKAYNSRESFEFAQELKDTYYPFLPDNLKELFDQLAGFLKKRTEIKT